MKSRGNQAGVIMVITLVALVVLLISGVALVRSFDTAMLQAGNLSFKRDMVNQGERGMAKAIGLLKTGALNTDTIRSADDLTNNYSASKLPSDLSNGIPNALLTNANFTSASMTGADLTDADVTIRYVIDRQCVGAGAFDASTCLSASAAADKAGTNWVLRAGGENRPVYRISVRVSGPRNTQVFLQTTVAI